MYVGFPRKDGPINLIIVSNPTTCVRVYLSMWDADVRCVCACLQACNRRIRPKCWEDTAAALPLWINRMSALQKTLQPVRYRNMGTTCKPRNKYATRRSHFVKKANTHTTMTKRGFSQSMYPCASFTWFTAAFFKIMLQIFCGQNNAKCKYLTATNHVIMYSNDRTGVSMRGCNFWILINSSF